MPSTYELILEHVLTLTIMDTHEHLSPFEHERETDTDVLREYLRHYFNRDLISAGLTRADYQRAIDVTLPLVQRWELVEPYWELARYTGYGRALDIAVRGLYGLDGIRRTTIEPLNEAFQESLKPGHYRRVLREKSQIAVSLLCDNRPCDRSLFRPVLCLDNLVYPTTGEQIRQVEMETGIRICAFEDWLEACEAVLDKNLAEGIVCLKSALAYRRPLLYERATRQQAEEGFMPVFTGPKALDPWQRSFSVSKAFQDYMMHYICRLANRRHLVFQFHTGIQEGNGNIIYHSDPALLSNLFMEYPDVDFDIFHIGYPYQQVLSYLAKAFPNVYIDMCWAHAISPEASVRALVEWLDAVPANKINAFGGDYCFIDGVYGHQYLARMNVSRALAQKVNDGVLSIDKAKQIAGMLFYDNPVRLFRLEGKI